MSSQFLVYSAEDGQNIFSKRELERGATVKESLTVQREGGRSVQRRIEFYNVVTPPLKFLVKYG